MTKKDLNEFIGTGRRKTSIASVRLRPGSGKINVNGLKVEEYFPLDIQLQSITAPFKLTNTQGTFDIMINVRGGGLEGQVIAARLGIARALEKSNETLRHKLKAIGYLTRDPRMKERKKYGHAGARKSFQFSKR